MLWAVRAGGEAKRTVLEFGDRSRLIQPISENGSALPDGTFDLGRRARRDIIVGMRTTLNIDDAILEKASRLTGVKEKTALVRMGLESLIATHRARRLAALGATEPKARPVARRRPKR